MHGPPLPGSQSHDRTAAPPPSPIATSLRRLFLQEDLNFLLTNRIPRRYATLLMGRLSRVRSRPLTRLTVGIWRRFSDLRLHEAQHQDFQSLQDCFTRQLKAGARPVDATPAIVVSPCDAIVGALGDVREGQIIQAKGFPYRLTDLLGDDVAARRFQGGRFVTLRLTANMYHRFHAPCDGRLTGVRYFSGDTWNVNPIALRRVERLFCRNERAAIPMTLASPGLHLTLVPVAAILVASIRLHCLPMPLNLQYRGPHDIPCDARVVKGQELGYFEHGSTIVLLASAGFAFPAHVVEGQTIRAGAPLLVSPTPLSRPPHSQEETDTCMSRPQRIST